MSREVTQSTQPPRVPAEVAKQSQTRTLVTRILASAAITAAVIWLVVTAGLDFVPPWERLWQLDAWVWVQFVVLWLLGTFMRVHRWVHLLRPIEPNVPKTRVIAIGLVAYAATFAPMRMGEFVRPLLISRDKQVGFTQALGTVAAERIVDGVIASVMLALGYFVIAPPPVRDHVQVGELSVSSAIVPTTALGAMAVFVLAFSGMVVFYFWRAQAHSLVLRLVGLVSKALATWLTLQVERLSDSLSFLFSRRHGLAFVRDTLTFWALSAASMLVILRGTGAPISASQAVVILGVQVLGTAVPGPPGFFGTFQMGFNLGLALYYPELVQSAGEVAVFVSYGVQLLTAMLSLPLGLAILARTRAPVATSESPVHAARLTPLARVREWLLRATALAQARSQQLGLRQRAALRAAVQAFELAVRGMDQPESYRAGPPFAAVLTLYQDAVWWALQAAGESASGPPASLSQACAEHAALLRTLAGGEQQLARLRAELLEPARHSFHTLDESSQRALIVSARAFTTKLIAHVGQPEDRVSTLLGQRWLRPMLALASVAGIALAVALAFGPRDLAAGKTWTASSAEWDFPLSGKTNRFGNEDLMFHTQATDNPWVMIDLEKVEPVRGLSIENRARCCQDRAIPLIVEVSVDGKTWREVARQTELFTDWKVRFNPQPARFVRLRVPRPTLLHLRRVRVLG